jgi:2Fe-2S ferredoxin
MVTITFVQHNGDSMTIDAEEGRSLMENAISKGVDGIDADCGGGCACGTCHVFVDPAFYNKLGAQDELEDAMLSMRPDRESNSRLSCQIQVTSELDGMVVTVPEYQM